MWPGTANSGGWRSPQASAGTPNNTREPARSDKKKPQPRTVGVLLLVEVGSIQQWPETTISRGFHFSSADCYRQSYRHNLIAWEPATGYAPHLNALPNASPQAGSTGAESASRKA